MQTPSLSHPSLSRSCPPLVLLLALCAGAGLGCSSSSPAGAPLSEPDDARAPAPAPLTTPCLLSADCPPGLHCDLGECVQSCDTDASCDDAAAHEAGGDGAGAAEEGRTHCSPRGRCLPEGEEDRDPPPPTASAGTLHVDQRSVALTARSEKVLLRLSSDSAEPVRYRVVPGAPYLSVAEPRGEFTGETFVELAVDPSRAAGSRDAGSIRILSTLGERVVETSIQQGLTGRYQGALRYVSGDTVLGDARVSVDLLERQGDVDVRFDPDTSLLFPASGEGAATTGFGSFTEEDGAELVVVQRVDAELGGARNLFARPLGRRLVLRVSPTAAGDLEGTFTETIHGLFEQPIEVGGQVSLRLRRGEPEPNFELSPDVALPPFERPEPPYADLFESDAHADCETLMISLTSNGTISEALNDAQRYYRLDRTLRDRVVDGRTYGELMTLCADELRGPKPATSAVECAWLPATACGVALAARSPETSDRFNTFMTRTVHPSLLVAQQRVVDGLQASFAPGGLPTERKAYDDAAAALEVIGRWVLHPDHVGYLRRMTQEQARGAGTAGDDAAADPESFPAGRALARLLQVQATIDGERSRIDGIDVPASDAAVVRNAQERALLAFLEAVTVLEIASQWELTPDVLHADLDGLLHPLDTGFGALLEGARAFGVPEGFVPFVWRPEDVGRGATNFEQMLALATESVAGERALEEAYVIGQRAFESSEAEILREAQNLRATYDLQIAELCGGGFDVDAVSGPEDWQDCGADNGGEVGSLLLDVELMRARVEAAHARLQGLADKIEIDRATLARTQGLRAETMRFVDSTGRQLDTLTMAEGTLNAIQQFLTIASNASVLNFGTPYGMAAAAAAIEAKRTAIHVQRDRLQRAQSLRFQEQDATLELIQGMAQIQKQLIDLEQLGLETMQEDLLATQAEVRLTSAVERAKRLHRLRRQAIAIADRNPAHDPSFRILRDQHALQLLDARARAQRQLYLAGRALEYEVNTPIASLGGAVLGARNGLALNQLATCLKEIHTSHRVAFGNPQSYTTELSVREMLGITGPREDEVTGQVLSPGEVFRQLALRNASWDERGALTITFSTNLQPGNGLWATDVCGDRITSVQAQLVGDFLGDDEAQVNVSLSGAAVLAKCDSEGVEAWSMADGTSASQAVAVLQAGVNSFGKAAPNASLFGQSVARASWRITLPPGDAAPSNADLDPSKLEDIVLRVEHQALPRRATPLYVDTSCLAGIQ